MADPLVPVSWGELLDKIAILEIKCQRLRAPEALANAAPDGVRSARRSRPPPRTSVGADGGSSGR